MSNGKRLAKINVTVLVVLILVMVAVGASLFSAREVRRNVVSKMELNAGQAAFEKEDWSAAQKHFQRYLGRNPDDLDVLKKYAKARLSVRPLDGAAVSGTIAAYRRVIQLDSLDDDAYKKLAQLYAGIGNFEDLAYVARTRMSLTPDDPEAPLWLAEALIRLRKTNDARKTLDEFVKKLDALAERPPEYVQACALMSQIASRPGSLNASDEGLDWLNRAVEGCPESAEALAHRARFYRLASQISGTNEDERLALAYKDLEAADSLGTEDPRIRLFLGAEWLEHGQLDRTAAELHALENLPSEAIEKYFLDPRDWIVARFLFASQVALKSKATAEGVSLADEVLVALTETRHRARVLPSAIALYVAAGRVPKARRYLDEYIDAMYTQAGPAEPRLGLAYLQALVAKAEERPYAVIDVLQSAVVSDASRPELWRLLAEAFSRTDQARRAVSALVKYLRIRPRDPEMTLQLAKEYLRMRDWNRALETARLAEPMNPTDIVIRLLRIEASIYRIAEQSYQIDTLGLSKLSEELADLRKDHPDRVDIRILQASIADYLQKPDEAEQQLKQAIEECQDPLRAQMHLVRHYQRTRRMGDAVSTGRTACDQNPDVAEPWLTLSGLYVAKTDYDSARTTLKQGLASVVGKWEQRSLAMQLALLELSFGDQDQQTGISLLEEVAEQDKQEVRARYLLLSVPKVQQNRPKAERLIEELKQAEGESGLYWRLCQAALWLSAEDWRSKQPDITAAARQCIDSDPEWSAPVLLLVKMYEKLEDFRRLEETCRQALVRNPSATAVADVLINLLERQGRYSDAENVLSQIETNPRVASAYRTRMAFYSGDFKRAIEELRVRVSNDDRDTNSRILLARLIYWQTGDAEQAFGLLKEAEAISQDSMVLTAAKVAILKAEGKAQEAEQILNDYVANSNSFSAYTMRAAYLANSGQLGLAEQDYRKLTTFSDQGSTGYELLSEFYARTERLDDAVTALEEGLAAFPEDLRLTRKLMKTLFYRGRAQDRERAFEILTTLQAKLPQDPELMEIEAMHILRAPTRENVQIAKQKLQEVIRLEPTAINAHITLIQIAMQEGQYEIARDSAVRALGANPDNPVLLSARAGAELLMRNTQMAAELTQLALEKDPNSPEARDVLAALVTNAVQDKDEDETLLKQVGTLNDYALASDPTDGLLLLSRARLLLARNMPEAAIPELEVYCRTEKGGGSVMALTALADAYRLSGDMDRAEQMIKQAEKLDASSLAVINGRLLLLASQNRFAELSQISSAYLSAKPQDPATFVKAAKILASSGSPELRKEAVTLFERAVTLSPTFDARLGLASTLYQTGDADRAVLLYEDLLSEEPNDIPVLNDLAWITQERDHRYDDALELVNRGLTLDPNQVDLLDTRATILCNMGNRLDEAKDDYARIVELAKPESRRKAAALLNLGRTCLKLNDPVQARKHLQDAQKIDQKIDVFTADERSEIAKILDAS